MLYTGYMYKHTYMYFPNNIVGVIMMKLFCRGLKFILSKWENAGFGRDLREMMMMLQAGNAKQAESEVIHICSIIYWYLISTT